MPDIQRYLVMIKQYLIKFGFDGKPRKNARAHLWNGTDTYCTMASTGGLKIDKYSITETDYGKKVCQMCLTNYLKF